MAGLGASLQKPRWDLNALPKFEKHFYVFVTFRLLRLRRGLTRVDGHDEGVGLDFIRDVDIPRFFFLQLGEAKEGNVRQVQKIKQNSVYTYIPGFALALLL